MTMPHIPENYQQYLDYMPIFLIALTVSFLATPIAGFIARKLRVVFIPPSMRDKPRRTDFRHAEKQPTPLLGGMAVIPALLIITIAFTNPSPQIIALIVAVTVLFIMGLIDDIHELSGGTQLLIQVIAALFLATSTIDIPAINNPLNGTIPLDQFVRDWSLFGLDMRIVFPGDILLFVWIILCTISVKVTGGTDGLMEGNSLISCVIMFLLSVRVHNNETAILSIAFAGLIVGFLVFNFYPAKIQSGSSGKSTYGFILAVLSVLGGAKFATAILMLLLPVTDFVLVLIGRYIRHRPRNPLKLLAISDRTHFHHKLQSAGFTERNIAFIEYLITAVLGAVALAISGAFLALAILVTLTVLALVIAVVIPRIHRRMTRPPNPPEETPEAKYSY